MGIFLITVILLIFTLLISILLYSISAVADAPVKNKKPHVDYFDKTILKVRARVSSLLPDEPIRFVDETWDGRFYLVRSSSDVESGAYYRFDTETNQLQKIADSYPQHANIALTPMTPIKYASDDGVMIPSYVSRPAEGEGDRGRRRLGEMQTILTYAPRREVSTGGG